MSGQPHPQVRWVVWGRTTQGFVVRCTVCGAAATAGSPQGVDAFAAAHQAHQSPAQTHYGAGDLVARATKALGVEPCTPCEQRRRDWNQRFPRLWPRRG